LSYIDTFDHELVGFFAGLPVYHPLETVNHLPPDSDEFNCTPQNLIIGGGGGEHPAIIILRPDYAVAHFIDRLPIELNKTYEQYLSEARVDWAQILAFSGWSISHYHDFYMRCTSGALYHPFSGTEDSSLESWFIASIGEFILFSMPELFPDMEAKLPDLRSLAILPLYLNVLIPPPGYNLPFGRRMKEGQITWGQTRWFTANPDAG